MTFEPWMLSTGVPTAAIVALWVRFESTSKVVDEIKMDVKRINGQVARNDERLKHLEQR